jgi:L-fuconolactonase
MRIDAHQHFWNYEPVKDSWMDETMGTLKRNYLPEDIHQLLIQNKIDGCVSVQADQSENETDFLLAEAKKNKFIKGVVGWVDLQSPKVYDRLKHFKSDPKFCGVRHIVQAEPVGFMLKPAFKEGLKAVHAHNLTYDILIYPHQLDDAIRICEEFPEHKFIIDHLAKPYIRKKEIDRWTVQIRDIASGKNVRCKLSGLVTEADWKNWKADDLKPYLDVVSESFGEDCLLFGSDWPVCLLAAEYSQTVSVIENYFAASSEKTRAKIMGLNAIKFYNLT